MKKSHLIAKYNNFAERIFEMFIDEVNDSYHEYLPDNFRKQSNKRQDELMEKALKQAHLDIRKILLCKLKKAQNI